MHFKIKMETIVEIVLLLFAMNFMNMESKLVFLLLLLSVVYFTHKIKLDMGLVWITLFSASFYLLSTIYHPSMMTAYIWRYVVGPIGGYIIGVGFYQNSQKKEDQDKYLLRIIFVIIIGRFIHGFLNMTISGNLGQLRNGTDIWTRSIIAATGQGALMTLSISLLFYVLFMVKWKDQKREKIILLFMVIASVMNSLITASRTAVIIMATVFVICSVYMLFSPVISRKEKRIFKYSLILFVALVAVLYLLDFMSIQGMIQNSPLMERILNPKFRDIGDQNRYKMFVDALYVGINHPFGDGTLNTAHNLWLDIFKQTGWFPFLFLMLFSIYSVRCCFRIFKNSEYPINMKILLLSILTAFLMNFAVEPIMKGMPYYFTCFCIFAGMITGYSKKYR